MTQRTCIALVDATRARLLVHERVTEAGSTSDELVERSDFVNPARRLTPNGLFSDTRTGSNRAGDRHFGFDDHRDAHVDRLDDAFARVVAAEIESLIDSTRSQKLVLCASPHMLGMVRKHFARAHDVTVDEVARDLVKLTPAELRARLASYGLLPPQPERAAVAPGR